MPRYVIVRRAEQTTGLANWFPNYPIMSIGMAQGPITDNLLDATQYQYIADYDVWAFQWSMPTVSRLTSRCAGIDGVWANQVGLGWRTQFLEYRNLNQTIKVANPTDDPLDVGRQIVESPTEGNPNWYLKRPPPNQATILEPNFSPAANRQLNPARGAGLNSLSERFSRAFHRQWRVRQDTGVPATDLHSRLAGHFYDNYNQRVPQIWTGTTTPITDYDMNGDGTADSRADYTSTGGSGRWALGHLDALADDQLVNPGFVEMVNTAEYDGDWINGVDSPPLPFSSAPHYQKLRLMLAESRHLSLGFLAPQTNYNISGGSLSRLYRGLEMQKQMLLLDPVPTIGKGSVVLHSNTFDRVTFNQTDYEYARLMLGLSLLIERCSFSITAGASRAVPLDDRLLYLGDPLTTRSMGTLNTTTGGFTPKAAMLTVGAALFWWVEFVNGIVVLRGDYPSGTGSRPWPSADPLVTFPLPPAGSGKKWILPPPNYENPQTGRSFRNLSPLINTGADVTGIPMGCLTVRIALRVPV